MNSLINLLDSAERALDPTSGFKLGKANWNLGNLGGFLHAIGKIFVAIGKIIKGVK